MLLQDIHSRITFALNQGTIWKLPHTTRTPSLFLMYIHPMYIPFLYSSLHPHPSAHTALCERQHAFSFHHPWRTRPNNSEGSASCTASMSSSVGWKAQRLTPFFHVCHGQEAERKCRGWGSRDNKAGKGQQQCSPVLLWFLLETSQSVKNYQICLSQHKPLHPLLAEDGSPLFSQALWSSTCKPSSQ